MNVVELGAVQASATDIMRLFVLPMFAWMAYKDVQTRRVPNRVWVPVFTFATTLLFVDALTVYQQGVVREFMFSFLLTVSIGGTVPYLLWRRGVIGGADVKGVWALCVLFPQYPVYTTGYATYPVLEPVNGVFILSVLFNVCFVMIFLPGVIASKNIFEGDRSKHMFTGVTRPVEDLFSGYGRVIITSGDGLNSGVDVSVIKSYLEWRDASLEDVRADPCAYSHPATSPLSSESVPENVEKRNVSNSVSGGLTGFRGVLYKYLPVEQGEGGERDVDWWCTEAYASEIDNSVDAEKLRQSLDEITSNSVVWVTPSIPVFVLFVAGVSISLTIGNLVFLFV